MHPRRPWIVLAALAAFAGQAAVVYKWTDSDGVVHYSDQPVPGAERIVTAGSPSPAGSVPSARSANPGLPDPKKNTSVNYSQFAITSPAPEQTFFGDEVIGVHLAVEPALKPDQTITWHLNGRQLDDVGPAATSFSLPHLDRGTYAIAATVTDSTTGESTSTGSVTFYVHQPSSLSPQHQKP
jgi:Domain of unknown function (DUF4124)